MAVLHFDPAASTLTAANALYLATASAIAYEAENDDPTTGRKGARSRARAELGLDDFAYFDIRHSWKIDADTQAFAAANDECVVLSFRGTVTANDWITDVIAPPVPFNSRALFPETSESSLVHVGFAYATRDCWASILPWLLSRLAGTQRPLFITGHSLGGALAVAAAAACLYRRPALSIAGLYTYGQPRVGQQTFCANLDAILRSRFFRFINRLDPVPRVPFRDMDYSDCGQLIHFPTDGGVSTLAPEWNTSLLSRFHEIADFRNALALHTADHTLAPPQPRQNPQNIPTYIDAINANFAALDAAPFLAGLA